MRKTQLSIFSTLLVMFSNAYALEKQILTEKNTPEKSIESAHLLQQAKKLPKLVAQPSNETFEISDKRLKSDQNLTEQLLNQAIEAGNVQAISYLLNIYQIFNPRDEMLERFAQAQLANKQENYADAIRLYRKMLAGNPMLTPVRIQLAIALFKNQQNNEAKGQFEKALSDPQLPTDIADLVRQYLQVLESRDEWQVSLSGNYLQEKNVNNASSEARIENTPLTKGQSMLPQKAHGIGYYFGLERDFNLASAHYLHVENQLLGKNYWDNHDYDDITNHFYLGYAHKSYRQRIAVLPYYEQQWYGNYRYKRSNGGRVEFNRWLNNQWQLSTAMEYGRNFYHGNPSLNGSSKLTSAMALYRLNPRIFIYTEADFVQERTKVHHYGYNLASFKLGWGQEWRWGISSRLSLSYAKRHYRDNLSLGNVIHFDKRREDAIYQLNLIAWKRDWHLFGITPKLNFRWKQQKSNFISLYSYVDKSVNVLFEKSF